jgi:hypothetical protein
MLQLVHPEGLRWWKLLKEDELFGHLGGSAPAYNPSPEEIEAYGDTPATAWRPLEALLDRALEHGLSGSPHRSEARKPYVRPVTPPAAPGPPRRGPATGARTWSS